MKLIFDNYYEESLISKLGFGTWGLGGDAYGSILESEAIEIVRYAYNRGIRFFDTAPLYGNGKSEIIIGKALGSLDRETFKIATKVGLYLDLNTGQEFYDFSENKINSSIEESKRRLNLPSVDLILFHSPLEKDFYKVSQYLDNFSEIKLYQQKIAFGVSLKRPSEINFFISSSKIKAFEFNFSLMDQRVFDVANRSIGFDGYLRIGRTPYNFGFLTSAPPDIEPPPKNSNQHLSRWSQDQFRKWHRFRDVWLKIAIENELELQELALIFALSSDLIDVVIPGFMHKAHVDNAIKVCEKGRLSAKSMADLKQIYIQQAKFHSIESK